MALPQLVAAPARLERMLASAVAREERFRPRSPSTKDSDAVTNHRRKTGGKSPSSARSIAFEWLRRVNYNVFRLCPNNFALSLNVFDRFLSLVKVQPKHVPCIAAASFLIAAKITQEPESEPSAAGIVELGDCQFTQCDVTRMERIILGKLGWDVDATTPLSVLQLMHALLCSWGVFAESGVMPALHLRTCIQHLESCLRNDSFAFFKPSALALAVLAVELRQFDPDWLGITIDLQTISEVTGQELSVCYEAVQTRMFNLHRIQTPRPPVVFNNVQEKVVVDHRTVEETPMITESILYKTPVNNKTQPRDETPVISKTFEDVVPVNDQLQANDKSPIINKLSEGVTPKPRSAARCLFPTPPKPVELEQSHCTNASQHSNQQSPAPQQRNSPSEKHSTLVYITAENNESPTNLNPSAKPFVFSSSSSGQSTSKSTLAPLSFTSEPAPEVNLPQTPMPNISHKHSATSVIDRFVQFKLSPSRCGNVLRNQPGLVLSSVKVA